MTHLVRATADHAQAYGSLRGFLMPHEILAYGQLSGEQEKSLVEFVRRRKVYDLGCGPHLRMAKKLVELGARKVVAVDKDWMDKGKLPRIEKRRVDFGDFRERVRTAFVSWPWATPPSELVRIVEKAETVIYLGKNFDGVICGDEEFWGSLARREVLAHVPNKRNTLIVYGKVRRSKRELLPEEKAGADRNLLWLYEDHHEATG